LRKRTLMDYPTISISEAAAFFNMGITQFKKRFNEILLEEIRWCNSRIGKRLSLIDVIKSAYPEVSNDKACEIAINYSRELADMRKIKGIERARKQRGEK